MSKKKKGTKIQLITLGDHMVGKTSILTRFKDDSFSLSTYTTIGIDFVSKVMNVSSKSVRVKIRDTAGQDRYKVMTKSYYRNAKACLIVYDITRRETFDNVKTWADQYMQSNASGMKSAIILGNKKDLNDQRQIKKSEGENLSNEIGCEFQEVSAKEASDEINELFVNLAETLLREEDEKNSKKVNGTNKEQSNENKQAIKLERKSIEPKKNSGCC